MDYTVKNHVMDRTDKNVTASTPPSSDRLADAGPYARGAAEGSDRGPCITHPRHRAVCRPVWRRRRGRPAFPALPTAGRAPHNLDRQVKNNVCC